MSSIVFTGGGTGGHVYPALAVFERLPDGYRRRVRWIGSHRGMEREIVERSGIPYCGVPTGKLRRYLDLENFLDVFRVCAGILAAWRKLRRLDARVVFSKGGFVAVPVVTAAWLRGIPVVIHESDSDPGLATRLTAPLARIVCVAYGETTRFFPARLRNRVNVTGNPVRREFLSAPPETALSLVGLEDTGEPVLLVTGGSLGANQLNGIVSARIESLTSMCTVVHQTGSHGRERIAEISRRARSGRYAAAAAFTHEFAPLLRRADLVICRAGAGTIWELAVTGTPAILVPLDSGASRGDQIRNARRYARSGAAVVVEATDPSQTDPSRTATEIAALVRELLTDSDRLEEMARAARRFARGDGAAAIAGLITGIIEWS